MKTPTLPPYVNVAVRRRNVRHANLAETALALLVTKTANAWNFFATATEAKFVFQRTIRHRCHRNVATNNNQ